MNTKNIIQRKGLPLVICAPSGAGKSTLITMLRQEFEIPFSISCTTREPRQNETDGIDYYFITKPHFEELRIHGKFAEWAEVHGNFYGTPLDMVQNCLGKGQDLVFDIDIQGAAQLSLSIPNARFAFILPPSLKILEERLRKRGTDSEEAIRKRLANAQKEILFSHWFDALIVNDNLETAYRELRAFFIASKLHPSLQPSLIRSICHPEE